MPEESAKIIPISAAIGCKTETASLSSCGSVWHELSRRVGDACLCSTEPVWVHLEPTASAVELPTCALNLLQDKAQCTVVPRLMSAPYNDEIA